MARDLVWIKTFADEAEAARAREMLHASGIEAVVSSDRGDAAWQAPPPAPGFRIGVHAVDMRAALDLVWRRAGG
jgi:hypothetical protein